MPIRHHSSAWRAMSLWLAKRFVIDPNGHDIWEGQMAAVVGNKHAVPYPAFPNDDEELTVVTRILTAPHFPETQKSSEEQED
jgi:hypothetical protein